jgi:hypothetical protein
MKGAAQFFLDTLVHDLKHGFRMLATGTDQGMLQEATRAMLEGMRT